MEPLNADSEKDYRSTITETDYLNALDRLNEGPPLSNAPGLLTEYDSDLDTVEQYGKKLGDEIERLQNELAKTQEVNDRAFMDARRQGYDEGRADERNNV